MTMKDQRKLIEIFIEYLFEEGLNICRISFDDISICNPEPELTGCDIFSESEIEELIKTFINGE